jgi:hypothetical protein
MEIKETEFLVSLDKDCRRRHYHVQIKNRVIEFRIQLEIKIKEKWYPVVRYDTAHGYAHRDTMYFGGKIDKTPLFLNNYNDALTFSEFDLKSNWQFYRKRFLEEVRKSER